MRETIELVQALRPWENPQFALYGLLNAQHPPHTVDAATVRDAFARVAGGDDLPPIGLTHIGVRVAIEFDEADWALVLPDLRRVAAGQAEPEYGYAIEAARRMLATWEIGQLAKGPVRGFLRGAVDPSAPPLAPHLLELVFNELQITVADIDAVLPRLPTAEPFVRPLLDALRDRA